MGNAYSMLRDLFFPGQPSWSVSQVPDLTGQVVIVTGYLHTTARLSSSTNSDYYRGNTGIGRETCKVHICSYIFTLTTFILLSRVGASRERRKSLHGSTQQVQG